MKKIFLALAFGLAACAHAATLSPVQLLNPAGSTSGQAIVSNGPSSAPTWQAVPLTGVTGVLPIANGGTNASTAVAARTNLGAAPTASPTFTGTPTFNGNPLLTYTAPAQRGVQWSSGANARWNITTDGSSESGSNAGSDLVIARYSDAGAYLGNAITFTRSSGTVIIPSLSSNMVFGNINSVVIGGTTPAAGSFTTLAASSTVSGTGFSTYLASPPNIGLTAPASGKFTTLSTTSTFAPNPTAGIVGTTTNDNANAGSFGEYVTNTNTGTSLASGVNANATSISLTAGDWDVSGSCFMGAAGSTTTQFEECGISQTSATFLGLGTRIISSAQLPAGFSSEHATPVVRFSLTGTTTIYLVAMSQFSVSTKTVDGWIRARRVR